MARRPEPFDKKKATREQALSLISDIFSQIIRLDRFNLLLFTLLLSITSQTRRQYGRGQADSASRGIEHPPCHRYDLLRFKSSKVAYKRRHSVEGWNEG